MLRGASFCPLKTVCCRIKLGSMKRISHILSFSLVALIVLTAQSAAFARTMTDATGQMVICTGTGPMMVYVDEQGELTGAPQICPGYALSLIVALTPSEIDSVSSGVWFKERADDLARSRVILKFGTPSARDPPDLN